MSKPKETEVLPREFPTAEYGLWENAQSNNYPVDSARWAWKRALEVTAPHSSNVELEERLRLALQACVDSWADYQPRGNAKKALDNARSLLKAIGPLNGSSK